MYKYQGELRRIVDGDTIDVLLDLGFSTFRLVRCRLARINTPELKNTTTKQQAEIAKSKLAVFLEGKRIVVESKKIDCYGRSLAEVWADDVNASDWLLENGLAQKY
jgi:micrococcal nuclease